MMFVSSLNYPNKADEVEKFLKRVGCSWSGGILMRQVPGDDIGFWTAPKNARVGDICLLMCAKSSIGRKRKVIDEMCHNAGVTDLSLVYDDYIIEAIGIDDIILKHYAGMVLGWAVVLGPARELGDADDGAHWSNRWYAPMGGWTPIEPGVSLLDMEPLIKINRRGGITMISEEAAPVVARLCDIDEAVYNMSYSGRK